MPKTSPDTTWSYRYGRTSGTTAQRIRLSEIFFVAAALLAFVPGVHADLVVYRVAGTPLVMILPEGEATYLPGKSINYRIPDVGNLTLHTDMAHVIRGPSRKETFGRMLKRAERKSDISACTEAARFALQSGLLDEFYDAARVMRKIDPQHPTVKRLIAAHKAISAPLGDETSAKKKLADIVKRRNMKFEVSKHYVLMHDVSDTKTRKDRTRAQQRIELLETVYRSYFLKFAIENKPLNPPKERMLVLLFGQEKDYLHYVNLLDPMLKQASGFWSPTNNVAVYFDQGTTDHHKAVRRAADELNRAKDQIIRKRLKGGRDIIQFAKALDKIVEISREQADVSVVSHEATHQLAGNSELLPRGKVVLRWAHEGLATYFETPHGAGWGGIGAVNEDRLKWYRLLQADREHSNIEFIVSDKIFDFATSHEGLVAAYGQAWALTHFLMETRFGKLVDYYNRISAIQMDEAGNIQRSELVVIFDEVFGDRRKLESEWRNYMAKLRSDQDKILSSDTGR